MDNGAIESSYGDDRRLSLTQDGGFWPNTTMNMTGGATSSERSSLRSRRRWTPTRPTRPTTRRVSFLHRNAHRRAKLFPSTPASDSDLYVFYFAGRPVATLDKVTVSSTTTSTLRYLSTDHLGTPILVTSTAGAQVWQGGFEPFGKDWSSSPTLLRFPGQWYDATWNGLYYNLNRWYDNGRGRYTQPDPLLGKGDPNPYLYAHADPLVWVDPDGLKSRVCCTPIAGGLLAKWKHCFIHVQDEQGKNTTYELIGMGNGSRPYGGPLGCTFENDSFDTAALDHPSDLSCGDWSPDCKADECAKQQKDQYPRASQYSVRGTNSNTFAGTVARACGLTPPAIAGTWHTPGWGRDPAQPFPNATPQTCPLNR